MVRYSKLRRWGVIIAAAASMAAPGQAQDPRPVPPPPQPVYLAQPQVSGDAPVASADPDHPAFGDVIDAMTEAVDQEIALDNMSASIAREYAKVPEIAALEAVKPGLIDATVQAMRPILMTVSARVQREYRPRMQAVLARKLSPAEAMDIAAFYRSPLGMKMIGGATRGLTMENSLSSVSEFMAEGKDPADMEVSRSQVEKDITSAALSGIGALTGDELQQMGRLAQEKPALLKLNALIGDIISLRTQMENEQPTAEENAAIEKAVIEAVTLHLGK